MGGPNVLDDEDIKTTWRRGAAGAASLQADPDSADPDGTDGDSTDTTDGDSTDTTDGDSGGGDADGTDS